LRAQGLEEHYKIFLKEELFLDTLAEIEEEEVDPVIESLRLQWYVM
jgi:hypothetical protein